jgi:hypothetical protein
MVLLPFAFCFQTRKSAGVEWTLDNGFLLRLQVFLGVSWAVGCVVSSLVVLSKTKEFFVGKIYLVQERNWTIQSAVKNTSLKTNMCQKTKV